jgi:AraC family transcriptional regulator of adaptative response/methylated-DNA-[protein]-cysteine methyltransferase
MGQKQEATKDYLRIKQAIEFIEAKPSSSLKECAQHLHLSPEHFQKLFTRWAGVSPKQYSQFLKKEYAVAQLKNYQSSLQEISFNSGLSSSGRLHDLIINFYGMTPKEYAKQGESLLINYGECESPFGKCFLAATEKGICKLAFFDNKAEKEKLLEELLQEWSKAKFKNDEVLINKTASLIFDKPNSAKKQTLKVLVKGTHFQLKVWEALLAIREGTLCAYSDIAKAIEQPSATRAVSSAIANNNVALLVPCHRVIRQSGESNLYRWGKTRKKAIIGWEAAHKTVN